MLTEAITQNEPAEGKLYVPQFKEMRFLGPTGKADFEVWLNQNTAFTIYLENLGQDMTVLYIHESGEILHCDFHGKMYNGMFVNLDTLQPGKCVEMYIKDLGSFEPFVRLIIEEVEATKSQKGGEVC
jgi:hypothetical protein